MVVLCGVRTNLWEMNNSMSPLHTELPDANQSLSLFSQSGEMLLSERMYALETVPATPGRFDGKMIERGVCCDEEGTAR
jgi:hypothetical protein